eukprot:CCRYP_008215-RA/>CCRYP_008215-RA protein AED:0.39 eAED:0.39 QI:0/-1/0/1/-1/1/1/0/462
MPRRIFLLAVFTASDESLHNMQLVDAFARNSLRTKAASPLWVDPYRTSGEFLHFASVHSSSPRTSKAKLFYSESTNNQVHTTTRQSSSSVDKDNEFQPHLRQLFLMMRPINFPIVTLFHVLGVHLSVELWKSTAINPPTPPLLLPLLKHPSMLMVLLSLLLVTSTSMITNDYYDARNGVDISSSEQRDAVHYHPLAQGLLSFSITKTFDSYLYAILLLSSAFVPGVLPRLMVISGAIVTYLYTVHLKPKTWIKNWSCAALVAISPVTSGLAAWHVLCGGGIGTACAASSTAPPFRLLLRSPLAFLVVALFAGITSREILMDITDCESDARAGIRTIPVKYGRDVAAKVALGWSCLSSVASCALPLAQGLPLIKAGIGRESTVAFSLGVFRDFISVPLASLKSLLTLLMTPAIRRLSLSVIGSTLLLYRAYSVFKTKGEDTELAELAIGSSLFSVLLVLASFV